MTARTWVLGGAVALGLVAIPAAYLWRTNTTYRNFRVVEDGVFYRSGQLSPDQFRRVVRELGIRTVVSFRDGGRKKDEPLPNADEEEYCREHGIAFVRLTQRLWYARDGGPVPAEESAREFVRVVEERRPAGPILVHCFAGEHRTGVFTAVYRMEFNGWSNAEAIIEMEECGFLEDEGGKDMVTFLRYYTPQRRAAVAQ